MACRYFYAVDTPCKYFHRWKCNQLKCNGRKEKERKEKPSNIRAAEMICKWFCKEVWSIVQLCIYVQLFFFQIISAFCTFIRFSRFCMFIIFFRLAWGLLCNFSSSVDYLFVVVAISPFIIFASFLLIPFFMLFISFLELVTERYKLTRTKKNCVHRQRMLESNNTKRTRVRVHFKGNKLYKSVEKLTREKNCRIICYFFFAQWVNTLQRSGAVKNGPFFE